MPKVRIIKKVNKNIAKERLKEDCKSLKDAGVVFKEIIFYVPINMKIWSLGCWTHLGEQINVWPNKKYYKEVSDHERASLCIN